MTTRGRSFLAAAAAAVALTTAATLTAGGLPATADAAPGANGVAAASAVQRAEGPQGRRGPSFKIGSFNVLGSQHTAGRGGYGPGSRRAAITADVVGKRGIDVIGLQEVQLDQHAVLAQRLPGHRIWPGTRLGNQGIRLQIAWRTRQFDLVRTGHVMTRFDRQTRPIPWVLLEHERSGRRVFVVTIHNSPRGQEGERDSATAAEIRLINRLRSQGKPVLVTGDMNEKAEWYCKVTRGTDLKAANGGRAYAPGCHPPRRRLRIDWIMGGRRVDFTRYQESRGRDVRRASDHQLLTTRVRLLPKRS